MNSKSKNPRYKYISIIGSIVILLVIMIGLMYNIFQQSIVTQEEASSKKTTSTDKVNQKSDNLTPEEVLVHNKSIILEALQSTDKNFNKQANLNKDFNSLSKIDLTTSITEDLTTKKLAVFDAVKPLTGNAENMYLAYGWGLDLNKKIDYVILADETGQVIGAAIYGINRQGLGKTLGLDQQADTSGWEGYFISKPGTKQIIALGKIEGIDSYVRMGNVSIPN